MTQFALSHYGNANDPEGTQDYGGTNWRSTKYRHFSRDTRKSPFLFVNN